VGYRAGVDKLAKRKLPVPCRKWKSGHPGHGLGALLPRMSRVPFALFLKRYKYTIITISVRHRGLKCKSRLDYRLTIVRFLVEMRKLFLLRNV
jgi:hypothetical protein